MTKENNKNEKNKGERIAKVIARAGICSRRDAEKLIAEGKVKVNGKVLETPAFLVTNLDRILVREKPLPRAENTKLYIYHKPPGRITTNKDELNRPTIFEALPKDMPRVVSVGRLDMNSEGLLLLTNDGELSRYLELPSTGWKRKYRVRAFGTVDVEKLEALKKGIVVDGIKYASIEATLVKEQGSNNWLEVTLIEGKNREIRRVMEAIGLDVNRLIRVSYGPFQLGHINRGEVVEIKEKVLKDQVAGFFNKR